MNIHGIPIEETFAEAFDMKATRLILTAHDRQWVSDAAQAFTGFATSVIACGIEMGIERELTPQETPDGRPGVAILAFAVSSKELEKQIPRRAGQCVLTCPTTALFAGIESPKPVPLGKTLRFFGDGFQISKSIGSKRYWRIPVMDGEFLCEQQTARVDAIGGGNFFLFGADLDSVTIACRAAIAAIKPLPGVITPFPGGATRSGSKVGSKYPALFASTNEAYCPTLRGLVDTNLPEQTNVVLEVVIDGLTTSAIAEAIRVGIRAACEAKTKQPLVAISAGNYGGNLGKHHFHLYEVLA
ncbi:Formyltransferase/hydrolase complex subunit D [Roseimaritima multifibrata]|uniref:Formylmethanofuran--tetrahydromethanopterin formyltransferase n=1 Tax=Roseimaritima multifibrata TaxID=1930274 RepID=A0A517MP10_9BACT|nr:formylmethanofuran--tetrahydromethanopterin N-formyltransferase [Roseimaritima multifibrata]QDS96619.1 Formyltransferase/hydrolase complex subunit D [Roseimaritima multifibrata]